MASILSQMEVVFVHILLSHTTEYKYSVKDITSAFSEIWHCWDQIGSFCCTRLDGCPTLRFGSDGSVRIKARGDTPRRGVGGKRDLWRRAYWRINSYYQPLLLSDQTDEIISTVFSVECCPPKEPLPFLVKLSVWSGPALCNWSWPTWCREIDLKEGFQVL